MKTDEIEWGKKIERERDIKRKDENCEINLIIETILRKSDKRKGDNKTNQDIYLNNRWGSNKALIFELLSEVKHIACL